MKKSRSNFFMENFAGEESSLIAHANPAPPPQDFEGYITWACSWFQIDARVNMVKIRQSEYMSVSDKPKSKRNKGTNHVSRIDVTTAEVPSDTVKFNQDLFESGYDIITIYTIYDSLENLVQLKFRKGKKIPGDLFKIIGIIIPHQTNLTNITINKGIDNLSLHELNKYLSCSNVIDICLDDTAIPGANYHIFLDNPDNKLRQLSLARCKIDDDTVMKIASELTYPLPASKRLVILNLASNKITDIGVKYIADALRSNRQLAYLNLADNSIEDGGSIAILRILIEFPVTVDEIKSSKLIYIAFLKEKMRLMSKMVMNLKAGDVDKKQQKKKPPKSARVSSFPLESKFAMEGKCAFVHPFSRKETQLKDGKLFCLGNNHLASLNLSYNSISFFTVKYILMVLKYQKELNRQPRGLVDICLEGNNIPENCKELLEIDEILDLCLSAYYSKKQSAVRRSHVSKSVRS